MPAAPSTAVREEWEPVPVRRRALVGAAALAVVASLATVPGAPTAVGALVPPSSFSFSGAGWGHGVGMSQYGARGMALDGYTGEQIVQHYYSGTTVAPVTDTMDVRVNVLHQRTTAVFRTEALASGGGQSRVTVTGVPTLSGDSADVWTVRAANGAVTLLRTRAGRTTTIGTGTYVTVHWAGTRDPRGAGTVPTVLNLSTSVAGLSTTGHRYRYGALDFGTTAASPTTFEAVNAVRIHDEYLLGIGEVPSSWPTQSLRAQVLASRSYALAKYGTGKVRASCRCHVDSGHGPYYDQTFLGYLKETSTLGSAWRAAVLSTDTTATTGEAILSGGVPITAFYFAASGGATQSSSDVWGGTLSYARSVDDHWSLAASVPWSAWTPRVRTQAQVAAAFGLSDVVRISLSSRFASGAVRTATAWSSAGASASISGAAFASRLSLPSTWVWRTGSVTPGSVTTAAASAAATSTATSVVVAPAESPAMIAVARNLASRKGWPLLLSTGATLPTVTVTDLKARHATTALLVGTADEAPAAVVTALTGLGVAVSRVTGATDADVSVAAAQALAYPVGRQAIVASAADTVSAVLAAANAARTGRVLLLVPGGATASAAVTSYLSALAPARTLVVGPATSVADSVVATMPTPTRVAGADAGGTSAALLGTSGAQSARLVVAGATTAVAGLLATQGAPLVVLTTSLPAGVATYLQQGVATVATPNGSSPSLFTAARRA